MAEPLVLDGRSETRLRIRGCIERRLKNGESLSYAAIRKEVGGSNATIQEELKRASQNAPEVLTGHAANTPIARERALHDALDAEREKVRELEEKLHVHENIRQEVAFLAERNASYFSKLALEISNLREATREVREVLKNLPVASPKDIDEVLRLKNIRLMDEKNKLEEKNRFLLERIRDLSPQRPSDEDIYEASSHTAWVSSRQPAPPARYSALALPDDDDGVCE